MSQDLLEAAKKAVEKTSQQHDMHGTWTTEIEYLKARNELLAVKNSILRAQISDKDHLIEQLRNTAQIRSKEGMEGKGFQSIGELAGKIAYRLSPREKAEALFKEAGE